MPETRAQIIKQAEQDARDTPGLRFGQACFNVLAQREPALAERIRGTLADPFYNDAHLPAFWMAVEGGDVPAAETIHEAAVRAVAVHGDRKISAIKQVRTETLCDLRTAKNAVDEVCLSLEPQFKVTCTWDAAGDLDPHDTFMEVPSSRVLANVRDCLNFPNLVKITVERVATE